VRGKTTIVIISRPDRGVVWSIDPERKTYLETAVTDEVLDSVADPDDDFEWQVDGREAVDGRECLRWVGRLPSESVAHCVVYVDALTQLRRRQVNYNKFGTERLMVDYLNVVIGPPDPALFELPDGLKRISLGR
jgi:hypothetical protein